MILTSNLQLQLIGARPCMPLLRLNRRWLEVRGSNKLTWVYSSLNSGGLTLNDFILAAKINDIDFADLMPKKKAKFWA